MSPLSPSSPGAGSTGGPTDAEGGDEDRPRLQRAHGPSKKTFKFRRSRHASKPEVCALKLTYRSN